MKIYEAACRELPDLVRQLFSTQKLYSKKKIKYYNSACGFDTESSSFEADGAPMACMYVWQLGLCNEMIIIGRTWEEYESTMQMLSDVLELGADKKRLVIYVHNLAWDFAFILHHHEWDQVFALEERSVCYAVTTSGIEFRCSYILTGDNLAHVADNLHSHQLKKLTGDLDYSLIRHSQTPLTADEIEYCIADVQIIMALIEEKLDEEKITRIPLTKTGYTRRYCRSRCMTKMSDGARGNGKWKKYRNLMEGLTITEHLYYLNQWAFQGGFTHTNARRSGRTQYGGRGKDINSDYPYQACTQLMPMSKFIKRMPKNDDEFRQMLQFYCCLIKITVYSIDEKLTADHPISVSRCISVSDDAIIDNGRLVNADYASFVCTELDWSIYEQFYSIKGYEIEEMWIAYKGYLPKDFILAILNLYHDKTALKGIKGKEQDYALAKTLLNSCYGMIVENPVRDDISLVDGEWIRTPANVEEKIEHYNKKMSRFTYYPWGIWITAYARRMLFDAIAELGSDYIYSDTDSVKYLNPEAHEQFFKEYNKKVTESCIRAADALGIDPELYMPKTAKGDVKVLGHWDTDAAYMPRFKSLGAKRYMYEDESGELHLTCAGLDKDAVHFIENDADPFEYFSDGMQIPPEYSGRKIHTYIDYETKGEITDYLGNKGTYHELSSVNLRGSDYNLSLSAAYADYILGLAWRNIDE